MSTSFLAKKVSTNLRELAPFIDVDFRSFTDYFRKNMIEEDIEDNMMIQLSHEVKDNTSLGELLDSSGDTCQKMMIIDGFYLQRIYSRIMDKNELQLDHLHLIFEDNLVCTYDENDKRYHARPIICGSPSIISISSIIEGPAKPKGYYFKQMLKDLLSISSKEIQKQFADNFVSHDDPRLIHVATGYAIQAIFFFLTNGNPFCSQYPCRLFNSHWQEELIYTQVINPVLCKEHLQILDETANNLS
jgi:hypothetical protein